MIITVTALVLGLGGAVAIDNSEQIKLFHDQMDKGYEWVYVGSQPPPVNTKFISISGGGGDEFILVQLKDHNIYQKLALLEE